MSFKIVFALILVAGTAFATFHLLLLNTHHTCWSNHLNQSHAHKLLKKSELTDLVKSSQVGLLKHFL